MKTRSKALLLTLCAVLLVAASVLGTMAYLTDKETVTNTFTVGKVKIELDEAKVDENGTPVEGAARVKANEYKLMPGHTYTKDPTVTVKAGSEKSYIKMTVTFSKAKELDAIFAKEGGAKLTSIFTGYDSANWIAKGNTEGTDNTRTYEFWYKEAVDASKEEVKLDALFDSITVPVTITKEQLAKIEDMTITVNAYAIQADGFEDADAAWAAFDKQK